VPVNLFYGVAVQLVRDDSAFIKRINNLVDRWTTFHRVYHDLEFTTAAQLIQEEVNDRTLLEFQTGLLN
jgi:hypothetical protein